MKHIFTSIFSDRLIAAVADTLICSLLAGVFLAAVAGAVVILTRKASAAARHNWLAGALALFTVGILATFIMQFKSSDLPGGTVVNTVTDTNIHVTVPAGLVHRSVGESGVHTDYWSIAKNFLNNNHNTIVMIWFLVICIKAIQLTVGLQGIYRLKHKYTGAVTEEWTSVFEQMIDRLGIRQKVKILATGLAQVPMAVGFLRPVVLIPIGLMTALSTAEIEAIILHELAHIRRRDYLVNLLQSVVEILFFFNPAVLWVSQMIKDERENCCDDMALAYNGGRKAYIEALVSCEEYRSAAPGYAMAMSGSKNDLAGRVNRLISKRNSSLNMMEKSLVAICLVISAICFSAFAGNENVKQIAKKVVNAVIPKTTIKTKDKQVPVIKTEKQADPAEKARPTTQRIADTQSAKVDTAAMNKAWILSFRQQDSILKRKMEATETSGSAQQSYSAKRDYVMNHIIVNMLDEGLVKAQDNVILDMSFELNDKEFLVNGKKQPEDIHQRYFAQMNAIQGMNNFKYDVKTTSATSTNYANGDKASEPDVSQMTKDQRRALMLNDLKKDDLVKDIKTVSFTLTGSKFLVNGVAQPDKVSQKYRTKYLTGKRFSWTYSHAGDAENASTTETFGEMND